MARKKKTMKSGIYGFIPNQPKYYPENVTNETINELYTKLTRNESKKNGSFINKMMAKKTSFLNEKRADQRFEHFLEILNYKLNNQDITVETFLKLYNYFKIIFEKYKETIIKNISSNILQGSHLQELYSDTLIKLEEQKQKFINSEKIKQNQNGLITKLETTNSLIQQYDLLKAELLPNQTGKTGIIQLSNDEKEKMSNKIAKLAKDIYDKAIVLRPSPDFTSLKESLTSLYFIYRAIFIDDFIKYGENINVVQGVANNKKIIALNLREKDNKLQRIYNNEQKKPRQPMGISYKAYE